MGECTCADLEEAQLEPTKVGVWPCLERSVYSDGGGLMGGKAITTAHKQQMSCSMPDSARLTPCRVALHRGWTCKVENCSTHDAKAHVCSVKTCRADGTRDPVCKAHCGAHELGTAKVVRTQQLDKDGTRRKPA